MDLTSKSSFRILAIPTCSTVFAESYMILIDIICVDVIYLPLFYTANDWRSESTKFGVEAIEAGVVLQVARCFSWVSSNFTGIFAELIESSGLMHVITFVIIISERSWRRCEMNPKDRCSYMIFRSKKSGTALSESCPALWKPVSICIWSSRSLRNRPRSHLTAILFAAHTNVSGILH